MQRKSRTPIQMKRGQASRFHLMNHLSASDEERENKSRIRPLYAELVQSGAEVKHVVGVK